VQNAQIANAIRPVVINNTADGPVMGGAPAKATAVTIQAVISQEDGAAGCWMLYKWW